MINKRINVLGFLSKNGSLKSYIKDENINTDKVIEVFDDFANSLSKPTVVVLDNASYHKSKKFKKYQLFLQRGESMERFQNTIRRRK